MPDDQSTATSKSDQIGWPWQPITQSSDRDTGKEAWPRITVVTPSYNQGQFLEATLRSVILQDYPNLEYLVLDGGSDDESVNVIKKYEPNIAYWHSKKDMGQADALATGFEMSTGEILCWINSDDIFLPGALKHVARLFMKHQKTRFVYGNRKVINEDGAVINQHVWPWVITKYHWARGQYLAQECCFWRRDLYFQVGGIDRGKFFIMDYDLFYRMWKETKFRKTTEFLGCIRVHCETKNSKHQQILQSELGAARNKYGLKEPGYFMLRLLNRLDAMQVKMDRFFQKIRKN